MTNYYAVYKGHNTGIFNNWNECKKSINGYKGAIYKKFNNKHDAEHFIKNGNDNDINTNNQHNNTVKANTINDNINIQSIIVYTDGACSNNGRKNAKAGFGIYFGENDPRNLAKRIEGKQTNNAAEISAIIHTYYILENEIKNGEQIIIYTDSEYSIKCCSTYGEKCDKNGWKDNIPNKELVKKAYNLYGKLENVKFKHILAHTGKTDIHSIGNYHADRLANESIGVFTNMKDNPPNPDKPLNIKPSDRIYLQVAYRDKDFAKVCGAKWDLFKKKWYITESLDENNKEMIFKNFDKA